jgi:hypothetical protein
MGSEEEVNPIQCHKTTTAAQLEAERHIDVGFRSPLGCLFSVNERWTPEFVRGLYIKWLRHKLEHPDESTPAVVELLDHIAQLVLDGSGQAVHLNQRMDEVHAEALSEFIITIIKDQS